MQVHLHVVGVEIRVKPPKTSPPAASPILPTPRRPISPFPTPTINQTTSNPNPKHHPVPSTMSKPTPSPPPPHPQSHTGSAEPPTSKSASSNNTPSGPGARSHPTTQHSHLTPHSSIGYHMHPSIARALPADARIADVGTGTGIWAVEMSRASPASYAFHGFDISDAQFLPADSLPRNVTLGFGDFKEPIPRHLQGTFDLVNIRLIVISLGPEEVWKQVLANVLTLLKPGARLVGPKGIFWLRVGFAAPRRGRRPDSILRRRRCSLMAR